MEHSKRIFRSLIALFLLLLPYVVNAQIKDTAKISLPEKHKSIFQSILKKVTRSKIDSSMQANVLNSRNEAPFLPYQGKGIRNIIILQLGFGKTFTDTSKEV